MKTTETKTAKQIFVYTGKSFFLNLIDELDRLNLTDKILNKFDVGNDCYKLLLITDESEFDADLSSLVTLRNSMTAVLPLSVGYIKNQIEFFAIGN